MPSVETVKSMSKIPRISNDLAVYLKLKERIFEKDPVLRGEKCHLMPFSGELPCLCKALLQRGLQSASPEKEKSLPKRPFLGYGSFCQETEGKKLVDSALHRKQDFCSLVGKPRIFPGIKTRAHDRGPFLRPRVGKPRIFPGIKTPGSRLTRLGSPSRKAPDFSGD